MRSAVAVLLLMSGMILAGCTSSPAGKLDPRGGEVAPTGVVREMDIWVRSDTSRAVHGVHPLTLRFALGADNPGTVPGPEIRVKQGDTVRVRLHDGLHTIHWHGVRLPWTMDGVPDMTQRMGPGVFTYEFVAKDAGTFWYHCHVAAPWDIDLGMFGAFIVEPADADVDPPFDREATLMLHEMDTRSYLASDSAFDASSGTVHPENAGSLVERPLDAPEAARGTAEAGSYTGGGFVSGARGEDAVDRYRPYYDAFMINGKEYPETDPVVIASGETVRIRLINAGQLVHTMHLHGHRFLVTHKDGALLGSPYLADTLGLFPGERYDVYVTGDNPGHWDFHDHGGAWGIGGYATNDGVFPGGMMTTLVYEDWTRPELPGPVAEALQPHALGGVAGASSTLPPAQGGHHASGARGDGSTLVPIVLGLLP